MKFVNESIDWDLFERNVNFVIIYDIFIIKRENEWADWLDQPKCISRKLSHSFFFVLRSLLALLSKWLCVPKWEMQLQMIWWWSITIRELTFWFCYVGSMTLVDCALLFCSSLARARHALWQSFLECPSPITPRATRCWKKSGPSFACRYNYSRWSDFSKMLHRKVESFLL